jgi:hypothetical protein
MAENKDKTTPARTEKKVEKKAEKAEKKVEKKANEPARPAVEDDDEEDLQLLVCSECGLLVSIDESCGCEAVNLSCCGKKMIEPLPSMMGSMYKCGKCGLQVIIEDDCQCEGDCDLVCCGKPMRLCDE